MIFAEYLVARGATRAHWRIRRRRRTWALRVMRADATAVGRPTTFCFELCGRSDTSRALPQSSDAPPRPSANVRAPVPARARGSVRRRPRNHGPITHLPRRQAETAPPLNATYSSFDSHNGFVLGVLTKLGDKTAATRSNNRKQETGVIQSRTPVVVLAFSLPPSSS